MTATYYTELSLPQLVATLSAQQAMFACVPDWIHGGGAVLATVAPLLRTGTSGVVAAAAPLAA